MTSHPTSRRITCHGAKTMNHLSMTRGVALAGALMLLATPALAQKKKAKPERSVNFATSWDDAVREAKLLHLPIVVHNHGFY